MSLPQLLRILWAHRLAEAAAFALVLAAGALVSFLMPRQYTASTALFVDVRSPDPVAGAALPGLAASGYIATQADIIASDRVAQAVVSELRLEQRAPLRERWQRATDGQGDITAWLVQYLQRHLDVLPSRESSVIRVAFRAHDPVFAAEVANAVAQAYLAVNLELKLEPARQYAAWFEGQTKVVRDRLEVAQQALSSYQQQAGILASDERLDFETARLNETAMQLTTLQAQTTDSQSKRQVARTDSVSEVMHSQLVATLRSDIARLQARLSEAQGQYGPNHPQIQRTEQELSALRGQLAEATAQVARSIDTTYQVSRQRERDLQGALGAQKLRVLALNKQRDELNVLKRDVESAQRAFEAVSQRAAQMRLESLSNQTNVARLNPATPPAAPSQPRVLFNMLLAGCLGAMAAVATGLLLELANRRIRSVEDLSHAVGLPVLATIPSSRIAYQAAKGRKGAASALLQGITP